MTTTELTSSSWWHAPGMARNYRTAKEVNDIVAMKIFENAYYGKPPRFFKAIAEGRFTVEGDSVIVTF